MLTALCLILIVLGGLAVSIISQAELIADVFLNKYELSFYLFWIRIITITASFVTETDELPKITIKNKNKTLAEIKFDSLKSGGAKQSLADAFPKLFRNLDIINLEVSAELGITDSFGTAMISMLAVNLLNAAVLYLINKQKVSVNADVKANFDVKTIFLHLNSIFSITLADIIYGIIFGKKGGKNDS